jgi:Flp pilus assembly protein TadG
MSGRFGRDDRGQSLTWVAVFLPALLVVLGLVLDGGLAFANRRALQDLADGAAAAGAMQIETSAYATGGTVRIDASQAQSAAQTYLARHPSVSSTVTVGPTWVKVTVREAWPTVFMKLFGVRSVTMSATATATARIGQ